MKNTKISVYTILVTILSVSFAMFLFACSSSKTIETKSAEDYFNEAMKLFKKEDYLEAQHIFELIKLQYSASQYADDAQFYLGETYFQRKEYILAAYNYGSLRRNYPQSEFCKKSQYMSAICFNELSPPYDRDQEYTAKAIKEFSDFQATYPGDSLYDKATTYINTLRDKLAHREIFTAELYRKLYSPSASIVYYDAVINDFPDTQYYELAYYGKIDVLVQLKKHDEAVSSIDSYKKIFPNGTNIDKVKALEKDLKQ